MVNCATSLVPMPPKLFGEGLAVRGVAFALCDFGGYPGHIRRLVASSGSTIFSSGPSMIVLSSELMARVRSISNLSSRPSKSVAIAICSAAKLSNSAKSSASHSSLVTSCANNSAVLQNNTKAIDSTLLNNWLTSSGIVMPGRLLP